MIKLAKDMVMKSKSRLRTLLVRGIFAALIAFAVGVVSLSLWIELELKRICKEATQIYPGDKIEALAKSVDTKEYGLNIHIYKSNNEFIWALGQFGDKRALPFLRSLSTGGPCDHETNLCQGEIEEAIQKLETNQFNLPEFLWRGILN